MKLGFTLHPTKSDFVPCAKRVHLGIEVDLENGQFRVPSVKRESV